jgi:hypothetical protein
MTLHNEPNSSASQNLSNASSSIKVESSIGIGQTPELSLRVSGACLTLMPIINPDSGEKLALFERVVKISADGKASVQLQPIGGAAAILNPLALEAEAGQFNFDSQSSAQESDLRLYIRPEHWPVFRELIAQEFSKQNPVIIENSPSREIQEELGDLLGITINNEALKLQRVGCHFQDNPESSARNTQGQTVRVFSIDEVTISCSNLTANILAYCSDNSTEKQIAAAIKNGISKSSSICTLPLEQVIQAVAAQDPRQRDKAIPVGNQVLANNVYATVLHLIDPD